MRIWTIIDENIVPKTKIYHNEEITCFNTTTNFSLLVTGSVDQSLKIWQIDTGFLIQVSYCQNLVAVDSKNYLCELYFKSKF